MNPDEYYSLLTSRNRGLVSVEQQAALRQSVILVAGCGGIGAGAVEPLVRAGAESLALADNGVYRYEDAGREPMRIQDAGANKSMALATRVSEINPYAAVEVHTEGVAEHNVATLVDEADLIIDGIGATEVDSLRAKLLLHQHARTMGRPVVSGYDVAGTLLTAVYDYRDGRLALLDGKVDEREIISLRPVEFVSRLFSSLKIPIEMVPEFERQLLGQSISPPAIGYTSLVFGALTVQLAMDLMLRRPVRPSIVVDVPSLVRPRREQLKYAGRRLAMLYVLNSKLRRLRRSGRLGVYSPLDDAVFEDMRDYMEERVWESGSVIVRQGDPGRDFFVIVEGEVQVELEDPGAEREPEVIARLGAGQYFGELSLLTDQPRNASVVAASRCRVLSLSQGAFDTYLAESPTAQQRLQEVSRTRIREDKTQTDKEGPADDNSEIYE